MIGTPLWWGVQFALNFMDFIIAYVIAHCVVRRKIKVMPSHVLFCVVNTLALAPVFYLAGGYVFRIMVSLCMLFLIKMVTERKELGDLLIIFALYFIIVFIVQLPIGVIVWLVNNQIMLEFPLEFLVAQSMSVVAVLLVSQKFKFNQWFNAIEKNDFLKFMLFLVALITIATAFILNFEYGVLYLLFSAIIIIIIAIPLGSVLIKLYHKSIGKDTMHELANSLMSLGTAAEQNGASEATMNNIKRHAKKFGVDLDKIDESIQEERNEKAQKNKDIMTEYVEKFIKRKINSKGKYVKVDQQITYYEDFENVDLGLMLDWLGTLLDNAIEATHSNPIYIHINVSYSYLVVRIANEYIGDNGKDIQIILDRGYSTKKEGRGIGLHLLNQQVTEEGGKIKLEEYYEEAHNCHYLRISILFNIN